MGLKPDLFRSQNNALDGKGLEYIPKFLSHTDADDLLTHCLGDLDWNQELVQMFGRTHVAPRLSCAIADEGCTYRYRGSQMDSIRFSSPLEKLRRQLVEAVGVDFNYALATQYRTGADYVGWHSDDERDLVPDRTIANVSLGGVREFRIKGRTGTYCENIETEHGSLLLMHADLHKTTKHTLIKTRRPVEPRVVLSFREVRS